VTVTDCAVLITEGAVYDPLDRVPVGGVIDQITDVVELPVTVAVNCVLCEAVRVAFRGLMPTLTVGGCASMEIAPELPLAGIESPAAVDAITPEICTGIDAVDGFDAIWKLAVATVPSPIAVLLKPTSRQLFAEQVRLFPALVAAGPAVTVMIVMSEELGKDH